MPKTKNTIRVELLSHLLLLQLRLLSKTFRLLSALPPSSPSTHTHTHNIQSKLSSKSSSILGKEGCCQQQPILPKSCQLLTGFPIHLGVGEGRGGCNQHRATVQPYPLIGSHIGCVPLCSGLVWLWKYHTGVKEIRGNWEQPARHGFELLHGHQGMGEGERRKAWRNRRDIFSAKF